MRSVSVPHSVLHITRRVGLLTAAVLLIPAVTMQFTEEVNWGPGDFAAASVLIIGAGLACMQASRLVQSRQLRAVAVAGILLIAAGVWAHLAVDLFDAWPR